MDTTAASTRQTPSSGRRPRRAAALLLAVGLALTTLGSAPAAANVGSTSTEDTAAPTISAVTVTPTVLDVRSAAATVSASITASDDRSGIKRVYLRYEAPTSGQSLNFSSSPTGTVLSGTFDTAASLGTAVESGTWRVRSLTVEDNVGKATSYTTEQAEALGAAALAVTSNADLTKATVSRVTVLPSTVDVRGGRQDVTVEVDAADVGTGVSQLSLTLVSPSGTQFLRGFGSAGSLVAGNSHSGTYRFAMQTNNAPPNAGNAWNDGLPRGAEPGAWTIGFVQVYDRAANSTVYSGDAAAALLTAPLTVVSSPADVTRPVLASFAFSPTSIDVTSSSAAVQVSWRTTDDIAGVAHTSIRFRSPYDAAQSPPVVYRYGWARTRLADAPLLDGTLSGTVTFPQYDRAGTWTVDQVCTVDWVRNSTCLTGTALAGAGPASLQVVDGTSAPADGDGDGVADSSDNCPSAANATQTDTDGDGAGDACDADIDGDGLTNTVEIWLGCDPYTADSDGDGVGDWVEVVLSRTSPVSADTHGEPGGDSGLLVRLVQQACDCTLPDDIASGGYDRLVHYWYFGRSVTLADAQGAGYASVLAWVHGVCGCGPEPDAGTGIPGTVAHHYGAGGLLWIVEACGCLPWEDPSGAGGGGIRLELVGGLTSTADGDGDGIVDVVEVLLGCDPASPDTDGDGLTDREELLFGSDPTLADTDGDGMDDRREKDLGCDPRSPDSDGDGLPDGSDPAPRGAVVEGSCRPTTVADVVPVGTTVTYTGAFTTHGGSSATGHIDLPGGSTSATITGSGSATGTHTFDQPGVYTIGCRIVDVTGGTQTATTQTVVYDPAGGFVTGGGWIDSPAGAYVPDPSAAGPARFGFVSKYKKGASVPTGQTEFQFRTVGMDFHAGVYEWLVVSSNGTKAQYKGTGTLNGAGDYGFLLTAYDLGTGQGVDRFRIKIWDRATGATVYDNRLGTSEGVDSADPQLLTQGQVVIHK